MRNKEKKLLRQAVTRVMADGISIQDKAFKVLYQNQAHKDIVGGDKSGEYCYVAYAQRDGVCEGCPVAASFQDGKTHALEKVVEGDDRVIRLELTGVTLKDSSGTIIAGIEIVRNMSRRKEMEEQKIAEEEKERLISQLKEALTNIKTLKGLIPICAWCKRIRDNKGYWTKVETYIREHSDASFTHGICPECLQKEDPLTYKKVFRNDRGAQESEIQKMQKRQFERTRLRNPFTCVFKVGQGPENVVLHAALEDISEAGMCIRTDYPVKRNAFLISGDRAERTVGIVRWRRSASAGSRAYKVGIKFVQD